MRKLVITFASLTFLAVPFVTAAEMKPATPVAAVQPAGKAEKKAEKPARPLPFQVTVYRVHKTSNTFTTRTKAGKENVFQITEKTKILNGDDTPATLADIKADEVVRGSRIKLADNKWEAVKVIIGAKPSTDKEEEKDEDEPTGAPKK
ncbi:hypothetical protein ACXR0O_10155 [Verrucomicrobiota bacterium sgz303538]